MRPATLFKKKKLWHKFFPVYFANFLRRLFLQNTSGRLLLIFILQVGEEHYGKSINLEGYPGNWWDVFIGETSEWFYTQSFRWGVSFIASF